MDIALHMPVGRSFDEQLVIMKEIGIDFMELRVDVPGYWRKPAIGYPADAIFEAWPVGDFPWEYANPANGRPSWELKEKIESYGVQVISLYHRNEPLFLDKDKREFEVTKIQELCMMANKWNVGILRLHGGDARTGKFTKWPLGYWEGGVWEMGMEKVLRLIVDQIKTCIKCAEDNGVYLAMENHYFILQNTETLLRILEEVNSDYLGLTVDTGNLLVYGHSVEQMKEILEILAPYTRNTHFKDGKSAGSPYALLGPQARIGWWEETSLGAGDVPHRFYIEELKQCNYDGPLGIHGKTADPRVSPYENVKRSYEFLKSCL